MGHLINPVTYRIGVSSFWNSNWSTNFSSNYNWLSTQDSQLFSYINSLFLRVQKRRFFYRFTFYNLKIIRLGRGQIYLFVYLWIPLRLLRVKNLVVKALPKSRRLKRWSSRLLKRFHLSGFLRRKLPVITAKCPRVKSFPPTHLQLKVSQKGSNPALSYLKTFIKKTGDHQHFTPTSRSFSLNSFFWKLSAEAAKAMRLSSLMAPLKSPLRLIKFEFSRYVMYHCFFKRIEALLLISLKRLLGFGATPSIFFFNTTGAVVSAKFLSKFITYRLKTERMPVRVLMRFLTKNLQMLINSGKIIGFRVMLSGRFERRGRANYLWKREGRTSPVSFLTKTDYAVELVTLTNSLCGVKVWITSLKQPPHPSII